MLLPSIQARAPSPFLAPSTFPILLLPEKVLIEGKCPDLLPEWLRFVKGVVDSEDLPLSLSREKPQDTALISRIGGVLTKKIIRYLQDMMRKEPEKYKNDFFKEFGPFLKEVRLFNEGTDCGER